jgi:hypothetical protein
MDLAYKIFDAVDQAKPHAEDHDTVFVKQKNDLARE